MLLREAALQQDGCVSLLTWRVLTINHIERNEEDDPELYGELSAILEQSADDPLTRRP